MSESYPIKAAAAASGVAQDWDCLPVATIQALFTKCPPGLIPSHPTFTPDGRWNDGSESEPPK